MVEGTNEKLLHQTSAKVLCTRLLRITGAMKTTSIKAMETVIDIRPVHTKVKYDAVLTASRLKDLGHRNQAQPHGMIFYTFLILNLTVQWIKNVETETGAGFLFSNPHNDYKV